MKAQTAYGRTTLHLATEIGDECLVKLALDSGVDTDSRDSCGTRPIHDALNAGVARLLLNHGADPHCKDSFEETPLLAAAFRDDVGVVTLLLEENAAINARDDQGRTPLHRAVAMKKVGVVQTLLAAGAAVDLQDVQLKTPLHAAVHSGNVEIVRALLSSLPNPFLRDDSGKTPIEHLRALIAEAETESAKEKFDKIVSLFFESGERAE